MVKALMVPKVKLGGRHVHGASMLCKFVVLHYWRNTLYSRPFRVRIKGPPWFLGPNTLCLFQAVCDLLSLCLLIVHGNTHVPQCIFSQNVGFIVPTTLIAFSFTLLAHQHSSSGSLDTALLSLSQLVSARLSLAQLCSAHDRENHLFLIFPSFILLF